MYTVYIHTCLANNKKYIGITCQEPWTKRINGDGSGYRNCVRFWNAIQKYGWNNFVSNVLETCETENEANELEKHYISLYNTTDDKYGYNIKEGGEHQVYPQEIRERISKALQGKSPRGSGWHHAPETIEKIRNAQKGRPFTPEHYANVVKSREKYNKEHRPTHTFTEEDNRRAKEACQKKVRIVETGQTFNSMTECANFLGVLISNLSKAVKQQRKYKGFHYEIVCS